MKTQEHQTRGSGAGLQEPVRERRKSANRDDSGESHALKAGPERHWQELHQPGDGSAAHFVERVKRRLNGTSLATMAGVAATGFAIGALAVFQRRQSFGQRLLGSLAPVGRRMTKLRNHW